MHPLRLALALFATLLPTWAQAGAFADVEVYDRTTGHGLPIYEHEGRLYVAGEPRHQYELRIRNTSAARVLAVTSVDGVNVITGETAAAPQSGYVIEPWGAVQIEGWRKSLDEVATFYFTRLSDSYAARTGRPHDVGVIGVALFREQVPCCEYSLPQGVASPAAPATLEERAKSARDTASVDSADAQGRRESSLGTGHGHREPSAAHYVDFRRASPTPDETLVIYYDSRKNLVARGVLPRAQPALGRHPPRAFPGDFVRDP